MPIERQQSLKLLAERLQDLMAQRVDRPTARRITLPEGLHRDVYDVLCNVDHFLADTDIRMKDENYRKMQEQQMVQLIQALQKGAPRKELMSFNFL